MTAMTSWLCSLVNARILQIQHTHKTHMIQHNSTHTHDTHDSVRFWDSTHTCNMITTNTTQSVWSQCHFQYSAYEDLQLAFKTTFKTTFKTKRNDIGLGSHRTCRTWLAGMEGDIHDLHLFIPPHLLPTLHAYTHTHTHTQNTHTQHPDTAPRHSTQTQHDGVDTHAYCRFNTHTRHMIQNNSI